VALQRRIVRVRHISSVDHGFLSFSLHETDESIHGNVEHESVIKFGSFILEHTILLGKYSMKYNKEN